MKELRVGRRFVAFVDDDDFDRVSAFNWAISSERKHGRYVRASAATKHKQSCRDKFTYLHQFILGQKFVDHKDGNGLNCTKANLRHATKSQNGANRSYNKNSQLHIKGVSWSKSNNGYIAQIMCNGRRFNLGTFKSAELASEAYNRRAKELFQSFARI